MPATNEYVLANAEFHVRVSLKLNYATLVVGIIAACLVSSTIWILNDRSVWPWDQANYADAALRLWQAHNLGIAAWVDEVINTLGDKQPLMTWIGQFFVPFRHITGDFE